MLPDRDRRASRATRYHTSIELVEYRRSYLDAPLLALTLTSRNRSPTHIVHCCGSTRPRRDYYHPRWPCRFGRVAWALRHGGMPSLLDLSSLIGLSRRWQSGLLGGTGIPAQKVSLRVQAVNASDTKIGTGRGS